MVVKLIYLVVEGIMGLLDSIVPDIDLDEYIADAESGATWAGSMVGFLSPVLPVSTLADFAAWMVATYLPCWLLFVTVRWVYAHLPVIGNG